MPSKPSHLGQFEILGPLGAGGMGEVYLARDTKLHRKVAIKVLPPSLSEDPDRLSRLRREARTLAALNHPNIGILYNFQETDGIHYLVLQLVEGESLEERLLRGPLHLEDALAIFVQVARALEAAHERGIVHRDLKPGNIMVTEEGETKVLDFGLAKAFQISTEDSESTARPGTQNLTAIGIAVGTPAYMSPEQARAKGVDRRTDIWAMGCTFYESLTGKPPFSGNTPADVITSILRETPDWDALPANTPEGVRTLLRRCLERNPEERLKDAGDIAIRLEEALATLDSGLIKVPDAKGREESGVARTPVPASSHFALFAVIVATVCAGLLAWAVLGRTPRTEAPAVVQATPKPTPKPVRRFSIGLSPKYPLKQPNAFMGDAVIAISPDGSTLVYVTKSGSETQLISRRLDELDAHIIPGTEGAWNPFFSPDGQWLGFQERNAGAESRIMKIPLQGGIAIALADCELPIGAVWGDDDVIRYGRNLGSGIWKVSAQGGTAEAITTPNPEMRETIHGSPQSLAGGAVLLYGAAHVPPDADHGDIYVKSDISGDKKIIARNVGRTSYVPTGHLVYPRKGTFIAVAFDLDSLTTKGHEIPITEKGMASDKTIPTNYTFSDDGTLVYVPVADAGNDARTLVWVDREGREESIQAPARQYRSIRLSPDGTEVVADIIRGNTLWVHNFARDQSRRLTFSAVGARSPVWTPDGRRIVFYSAYSEVTGVYWRRADGGGARKHLISHADFPYPQSITPDGKTLLFAPVASFKLFQVSLDGKGAAEKLLDGKFAERNIRISPDGKWISYESKEAGRYEVYVQSYPVSQSKWQISRAGGEDPIWSRDGNELFYWEGDRLMAVRVELEPTFSFGTPTPLFEMPSKVPGALYDVPYDVSPDGKRFLVIKGAGESAWATELIVVRNWFEELKRLVPVESKNPSL